jgi:hypothetical protein
MSISMRAEDMSVRDDTNGDPLDKTIREPLVKDPGEREPQQVDSIADVLTGLPDIVQFYSDEQIRDVAKMCTYQYYPPGEFICLAEDETA